MKKISHYLKQLLISPLVLTLIFVFGSCSLSDMMQQAYIYTADSFHYEYGNSGGTHGEFWIWTENGVTYFEGSATALDKSVDAFAEVDAEVFEALTQVIHDNRIHLWNGFSKSDNHVLDGHGFSLDMKYGAGSIHARGYMYEPKNYQSGHDALLGFLWEYAEGLPVTIPPADSVGYVIVCTEEFRFDLTLSMYDGVYSRVESVNVKKIPLDPFDNGNIYTFSPANEIPAEEHEKSAELDFEPASQLRQRSLELVSSNGLPGKDASKYIAVHYFGHKIKGRHFCHAALPDEELSLFMDKLLSVVGLPADFDFDILFSTESR